MHTILRSSLRLMLMRSLNDPANPDFNHLPSGDWFLKSLSDRDHSDRQFFLQLGSQVLVNRRTMAQPRLDNFRNNNFLKGVDVNLKNFLEFLKTFDRTSSWIPRLAGIVVRISLALYHCPHFVDSVVVPCSAALRGDSFDLTMITNDGQYNHYHRQ
ncbi:hypothetical protein BDZ97DRAFT_1078134 [Flammula alnicola]|nr:hypothetical protein BDZ97DRAFT_1078134 [Flammula alnicola]